jgi:hypothetical protein
MAGVQGNDGGVTVLIRVNIYNGTGGANIVLVDQTYDPGHPRYKFTVPMSKGASKAMLETVAWLEGYVEDPYEFVADKLPELIREAATLAFAERGPDTYETAEEIKAGSFVYLDRDNKLRMCRNGQNPVGHIWSLTPKGQLTKVAPF